MAMKNIAAALGDLERENKSKKKKISKGKNTKVFSNKHTKRQTNKNIKTAYQSVKLAPAVKKKLWINRINTGETITAAINRIVNAHLK